MATGTDPGFRRVEAVAQRDSLGRKLRVELANLASDMTDEQERALVQTVLGGLTSVSTGAGSDGTRAAEHVPEALLAARVGVRDELDAVARVDLLEAFGEELQHARPRLFDTLDGHGDRDPAEPAQRNALLSLSKNPSPGS